MRKRGFTLIEVLIALVIFVVGALAVIRIFPPAFNVVQNSGYKNVATRLSDSILSQMKANGSTPDAVFDIDDSGAWNSSPIEASWLDQADYSVVGTSSKNASLPNGPTQRDYENSALMHYRFIHGEKHEIQNVESVDSTNPPYILTNFPYDNSGGANAYIEMNVNGVSMDYKGHLDFSRATVKNPYSGNTMRFNGANDSNTSSNEPTRPPEFLIFKPNLISATGWANFPQPNSFNLPLRSMSPGGVTPIFTGTRYYVSYRWTDSSVGSNIQQGVVDEPLNLPDDSTWTNDMQGGGNVDTVLRGVESRNNSNIHVVAGSGIQVKVRIYLATAPLATVTGNADQANLGYMPLPLATDGATPTAHSIIPKVPVYVDYLVPDDSAATPADQFTYGWRNILDQSVANTSNDVFLPVQLLEKNAIKAVAVNTRTSPNTIMLPLAPSAEPASNFNKGKVSFGGSADQQVRTSYRGIDGWARQISPTAQSYIPYVSQTALMGASSLAYPRDYTDVAHYYLPREFWREYYWIPGSNIIYFHVSDAGKIVSVSFIDNTGKIWRNQQATIKSSPENTPDTDFAVNKAVSLQFVDPANPNTPLSIASIIDVRGVGIVARTAWLDGQQYNQAVVTGYRAANAN